MPGPARRRGYRPLAVLDLSHLNAPQREAVAPRRRARSSSSPARAAARRASSPIASPTSSATHRVPAVPHPRRHVHQQGRRRDARAARAASSAPTSRATSGSAPSTRPARACSRALPRAPSASRATSSSTTTPTSARWSTACSRELDARRASATRRGRSLSRIHNARSRRPRPRRRGRTAATRRATIADACYAGYESAPDAPRTRVDFDDLLLLASCASLEDDRGARRRGRSARRFRYVLVDEFQDTNQVAVPARARARRDARATSASSATTIRASTAGAAPTSATSATSAATSPTRRSSSSSRTTARRSASCAPRSAVITPHRDREPKELWTGQRRRRADRRRRAAADERDEAALVVAARIRECSTSGVLARRRSPSSTACTRSRACSKRRCAPSNIPYQIIGGTRFFERAEVKDLLAYLRVLVNPTERRRPACASSTCPRAASARRRSSGCSTSPTRSDARLFDALARDVRGRASSAPPREEARRASSQLIDGFAARASQNGAPAERRARGRSSETGYESGARGRRHRRGRRAPREPRTSSSARSREYEAEAQRPGGRTLAGYLERVTLDDRRRRDEGAAATAHADDRARGEGARVRRRASDGHGGGDVPVPRPRSDATTEELEEERRLAYVAVTRARKRLVLSYASVRRIFGQTRYGNPSRFLDELPDADVERIDTRPRAVPVYGSTGSYGGSASYGGGYGSSYGRSSGGSAYGGSSYGGSSYPGANGTPKRASNESYVDTVGRARARRRNASDAACA